MNRKYAVALLLLAFLVMVPIGAMAAPKGSQSLTSLISFPVPAGMIGSTTPFGGGSFVGTFTPTAFSVVNGVLTASGTLAGSLLNSTGGLVTTVSQTIIGLPVSAQGSCQILTLTLGPLDLNLLGLTVHLNQVVLNITAVPGAGNLLGNLLCAVANLLNGGNLTNLLNELAALLTQIIAAL